MTALLIAAGWIAGILLVLAFFCGASILSGESEGNLHTTTRRSQ